MVVVMIVAISKFKIHPFLSIMGVSLILALLALPLAKVPGTIGAGFSGTFSSLGIVIILGAMIGFFLEKTGAALTMADWVIRRVGDKNPELAILLDGLDRLHSRVLRLRLRHPQPDSKGHRQEDRRFRRRDGGRAERRLVYLACVHPADAGPDRRGAVAGA